MVATAPHVPPDHCLCCGAPDLVLTPVLWPELIEEWGLAPAEVAYIDRQQGLHCTVCGANLRSMALALLHVYEATGVCSDFTTFMRTPRAQALRVLEVNEAGGLSPLLARLPGRTLGSYPEVDMTRLPYAAGSFDVVVHSDTLEHVPHPVRALAECYRVLRADGGLCVFTIPMVVGRLTRSREGLPPSYHGAPDTREADYAVATEYGADTWRHVIEAGFAECRVISLEYPAVQAFVGVPWE